MLNTSRKSEWVSILFTLSMVIFVLSGCALIGPRVLSHGRAHYNEAINRTTDQQMLMSIVKGRYGESFSILAVSGVASNVRIGTQASVDVGYGPIENYAGNLVPFRGGLAYEENPTITYAPVGGEKYVRQVLTPIPLDFLVLNMRTGGTVGSTLSVYIDRINDIRNPVFFDSPLSKPDPRFLRLVELIKELTSAGVMHWVADPRKEVEFDILITNYAPAFSDKVREYLNLLGIPTLADTSKDIILPVYFAVKGRELESIAISTRSTSDLIQILRAAIEVPDEHKNAGVTIDYPAVGLTGKNLRIHSSKNKPARASVIINYRGYWFYIDDTDLHTKKFFRTLRSVWSVVIVAATDASAAPVLTLPVSR